MTFSLMQVIFTNFPHKILTRMSTNIDRLWTWLLCAQFRAQNQKCLLNCTPALCALERRLHRFPGRGFPLRSGRRQKHRFYYRTNDDGDADHFTEVSF